MYEVRHPQIDGRWFNSERVSSRAEAEKIAIQQITNDEFFEGFCTDTSIVAMNVIIYEVE